MNENIKIINRFNLNSSILSISKTADGVSVVTQDYQACIIDSTSLSIQKLNRLIISNEIPHKYSKSSSSSDSFVCLCEVGSKRATIAKIQDNIKPIIKITSHKRDISASNFSKDSSLLATGGEDGRVYIYDTSSFLRILSLPYRPDYISSINFSNDSRFMFSSCFNKSNMIFDCQRAKTISIFNTNEVVEWGGFFENNSKLFLITRDFQSIIYDVRANQIINTQNHFNSWPNVFCIDSDEKIAIIGSRDSEIYLIHLKENSLLFHIKLEEIAGISSICIDMGYIFVGSINGDILIIGYKDENDSFKNACNSKNYALASKMLESNIFLSLLPCAKVFDEDWNDILKKAVIMLSKNKINEAIELVNPFIKDITKKNAFSVYLSQKDYLKKFQELIDKRAFEEAYNMSLQFKFLDKTTQFEELENLWYKAFNNAKKLLEENITNIETAKNYLEPFMRTPKKDAIMQLLNNIHIFKDADNFIKEQNFKEYFSLTSKFAYLKDSELYKKVLMLGENLFEKAINAKNTDDYDEFYKLSKFLLNFPLYKESITNNIIIVDKKLEILKLIRENKKIEAYKLADDFEDLQYLAKFKNMSKDFDEVYNEAKFAAYSGKVENLGEIFGDYIKIPYWSDKIKSIFQIGYLEEFKQKAKLEKASINWEQSIINYIQIFGRDDDIIEFCEKFGFKYEFENLTNQIFSFQKTLLSKAI
ncbi:WD40 repeat domain-containing protein [Helicobacter sp. MIT 14-3879]|uniref:WD40 repeat domain-containing protein n=1 Tax=Helicobacter sp. MIT 14-3879 TaxID=2040649 RepID=UPI000E1E6F58|nr:hypothetical protein [Helicobacter sp. MIT 14-3879]RDU64642.1 hypothetical protein CQA44_02710 [Helicobacter sp. MIT 14-3879]